MGGERETKFGELPSQHVGVGPPFGDAVLVLVAVVEAGEDVEEGVEGCEGLGDGEG